jgi:hypothetical protein
MALMLFHSVLDEPNVIITFTFYLFNNFKNLKLSAISSFISSRSLNKFSTINKYFRTLFCFVPDCNFQMGIRTKAFMIQT